MFIIVTNCTKAKLNSPAPARYLYKGPSVTRIVKVVDEARRAGIPTALYIISAKYGLAGEYDVLEPYDETLSGKPPRVIKKWAVETGVLNAFRQLASRYRTVLVVSRPYFLAVEEAVCEHDVYVLAPYKTSCGRWIKTGNFDRHLALKRLLFSSL